MQENFFADWFSQHVVLTIVVIAGIFFMFTRGGGGFLGSWFFRILLFVMLAVWIWIALMSYLDSVARRAQHYADEAQAEVANHTPQWMKDLWNKVKPLLPSPSDVAADRACDAAEVATACEIIKSTQEFQAKVKADQQQLEQICKSSPAVENKLGEGSAALYCEGNAGREAQKVLKAVAAGVVVGSVKSVSSLLVPNDPKTLDQQPYLNCLASAAAATPGIQAGSCKYSDPHLWRLCVEFHIQLAQSDPLHLNPEVSPKIIDCRESALGMR